MQVKKSKGFQLICVLLLVSVLLSGCTILQSQKKVQDLGVYGCTSGRDTGNAKKPDRKQIGGEIYTHIQR